MAEHSTQKLPDSLPQTPGEPLWREWAARLLLRTGLIHASEILGRRVHGRRRDGGRRVRPEEADGPRFAILCYHRIGTTGVPLHSGLPRHVFARQMAYLRKHYRVVSLDEILAEGSRRQTNHPAVAITFDDGYADLYRQALPVLKEHRIPATIYLIAQSVQTGEVPWYDKVFVAFQIAEVDRLRAELELPGGAALDSPQARLVAAARSILAFRELPDKERQRQCERLGRLFPLPRQYMTDRMLNWDQIREMHSAGISFGSHSMSHPMLSRLDAGEAMTELWESRQILENELQRPILDFAYPFGTSDSFDAETTARLAQCGYRSAVTLLAGVNTAQTDPLLLRRVVYCECDSLAVFAARMSRLFLFPDRMEKSR